MRYWTLLALMLIFSCKKKDETSPDVNISNISPMSATYQIPTTLDLRVTASDDKGLQSIKVEVRNQQNAIVAGPRSRTLNGETSDTWNLSLVIDDRYIESGAYFIAATASDERNSSSDFHDINLNEIPLTSNLFAVLINNGNESRIDTGYYGAPFSNAVITSSTKHLAFDPINQTIWASGNAQQGVTIYDRSWNPIANHQTLTGGEEDFFYHVHPQSYKGRFYAAAFDASIKSYNHLGDLKSVFYGPPSTKGRTLAVSEEFVIGAFSSFNENTWYVSSFYRATGAQNAAAQVNFRVEYIFPETDNTFILQGLENEQMRWARLYVVENVIDNISLEEGTSFGRSFYQPGGALMFFNEQLHYSTNLQSFFPIQSTTGNRTLVYDEGLGLLLFNDNGSLWANDGNYPLMNQNVANWTLSGTPDQVLVFYNK